MSSTGCYRPLRHKKPLNPRDARTGNESPIARLCDRVVRQFKRLANLTVVSVPLEPTVLAATDDPPANLGHPLCADVAESDHCRESWQRHVAELAIRPAAQWHHCGLGRLCALVPAVWQNQCLAVFRLVSPRDCASPQLFARNVDLLSVVVDGAMWQEFGIADERVLLEHQDRTEEPKAVRLHGANHNRRVRDANAYIDSHLCEPGLCVRQVASQLGVCPDYLSNLFAKEIGQRMSRYIAARRIEVAKRFLIDTDWQVKRIAAATGYANPGWFAHLFRRYAGMSPVLFREEARKLQARHASND